MCSGEEERVGVRNSKLACNVYLRAISFSLAWTLSRPFQIGWQNSFLQIIVAWPLQMRPFAPSAAQEVPFEISYLALSKAAAPKLLRNGPNGPKQSHQARCTSFVSEIQRATHDFGFERRLDLPVGDLLPIDPPEKLVGLDVRLAFLPASQTLCGILDQKLKREGGQFQASLVAQTFHARPQFPDLFNRRRKLLCMLLSQFPHSRTSHARFFLEIDLHPQEIRTKNTQKRFCY